MEFGLGPFFSTEEREQVCDFSVPVYTDYYALFMVRPAISSDVSGFTKPFTKEVKLDTICILASAVFFRHYFEMMINSNRSSY